MRRTTMTMGLGLALALGGAGVAVAQTGTPRPDASRRGAEDTRRGRDGKAEGARQRRGPEAGLLRGITLTDEQKTRLEALRREQAPQAQASREQLRTALRSAREARARGDTATARATMERVRARMSEQRERQIASLRSILTDEQRTQLDANLAERKARGERGVKARPTAT